MPFAHRAPGVPFAKLPGAPSLRLVSCRKGAKAQSVQPLSSVTQPKRIYFYPSLGACTPGLASPANREPAGCDPRTREYADSVCFPIGLALLAWPIAGFAETKIPCTQTITHPLQPRAALIVDSTPAGLQIVGTDREELHVTCTAGSDQDAGNIALHFSSAANGANCRSRARMHSMATTASKSRSRFPAEPT